MKYFILVTDGAGDYPLEDRGNKTPLQLADNPVVTELAHRGIVGRCRTIPDGMEAGSDVGHLSLLGYPPEEFHTGRAPLEAANIGVELGENDAAFRGNIVTLRNPDNEKHGNSYDSKSASYSNNDDSYSNNVSYVEMQAFENLEMVDHSSEDITTEEGLRLYEDLSKHLIQKGLLGGIDMKHGVSYRGAFVIRNLDRSINPIDIGSEPPHNILGKKITDYLPGYKLDSVSNTDILKSEKHGQEAASGENYFVAERIREIMRASYEFLCNHPVNISRIERGLRPGNCLWIWGGGRKPALIPYGNGRAMESSVISAVDLIKGMGILTGMKVIDVEGATGNKETDFAGKGRAAVKAFEKGDDMVFVHVEGPDECGHQGDVEGKIFCLEQIDKLILKPVLSHLKKSGERYKILVMPDHYTPIRLRTHSADPVPFVLYDSENEQEYDEDRNFTEESAEKGCIFEKGADISEAFLSEEI
ncbi:MAG: 2,3-bisphosphoglycerate-independent phosphoglycerate mutase [Christensenellales bacterium]